MLDLEAFKNKYKYSDKTPMMQQYLDIKFEYQDALLLFRMGDFYELFMEDALVASNVLSIALAKRSSDDAMCGVPYHALDNYLSKLVENGYKVAICEQMESPEDAKKRGYKAIVRRDVVRVITQGTILEESILNTANPNYLLSIVCDISDKENSTSDVSIAYLDISTGEFGIISTASQDLAQEIVRLMPKEILISDSIRNNEILYDILRPYSQITIYQASSCFAYGKCKNSIENFYNIKTVDSLGDLSNNQIIAIGVVLEYVRLTQKNNLPVLPFPRLIDSASMMKIDSSTRRNLELVVNVHGKNKNTLLSTIDRTVTKQGSRALYKYVTAPLADITKIISRLDLTSFFYTNVNITEEVRKILKNVCDIERILARISMNRGTARDLLHLKNTMLESKNIISVFVNNIGPNLPNEVQICINTFAGNDELIQIIEDAINPDATDNIENGGFINNSYHPKLDDLRRLLNDNNDLINNLKNEYIEQTGIETLKILHNNVIGLFIEVTPKYANKITHENFIHKQTLTTAIRFTTTKLQELESEIINAKVIALNLEKELFLGVCQNIIQCANTLRKMAHGLSVVDVFSSLAILALDEGYVRPEITDDCSFEIVDGRHPVVEKSTSVFISNDCNLSKSQRLWLITGPNMAGKSTFLRQNAIITILAQIGSFVPASFARIGVVDKLFSRIGAADDLSSGQSTFMMEMVETSAILAQSSERSLVILDEIGRGTSTHDGVSIALSCLEYIHDNLRCRGLFATHYHELTSLSENLNSLKRYTVAIEERDNKVFFLHKIIEGVSNRSYGIHVAEMAGLPPAVVERAKEILDALRI